LIGFYAFIAFCHRLYVLVLLPFTECVLWGNAVLKNHGWGDWSSILKIPIKERGETNSAIKKTRLRIVWISTVHYVNERSNIIKN
jgi:hypothetical protein